MKTVRYQQKMDPYLNAPVPFAGGVRRDLSDWEPGNGLYRCIGAHGNKLGDLTKWSGMALDLKLAAKPTGLFQIKIGALTYKIAMAGGVIYRIYGAAATALLSGEQVAPCEMHVLNNMGFMVSGINPNRKYDGTSITNLGIVAPTVAGVASNGAPGALTGGYSYKYTYQNSITLSESDPSPASNTITAAGNLINLTGIVPSTDPQVDTIRIFRTVAGGSIWLLTGTIANSVTSYADNVTDANLAEQVAIDNGVADPASYMEVFNGMLLLTGFQSPNQSRVWPSGVLRAEAFNVDNVYDLDPEDDDIITGIKRLGNFLAVGKRKGIFLGEGTAPDAMTFTRTRVVDGPLGNWTMVTVESNLFYLAERGPHVFTGLAEQYLWRPIEPLYRQLDLTQLQTSTGVYYAPLNMIIWNVKTAGVADSDQWLIFNLSTKEWTFRQATSAQLATYKDTVGRSTLWIGGNDGSILTGDYGSSDQGQPIYLEVISRPISFTKNHDAVCCFRFISSHYYPNGGASPVTVSYCVDDPEGVYTVAGTFLPTTGFRVRHDLAAYGRVLYVKYTVNSTEPLVLRPPVVSGHVLGRT